MQPDQIAKLSAEAGRLLGTQEPLVFPPGLQQLWSMDIEELVLDQARLPSERAEHEVGLVAETGPIFYAAHQFADFMPAAWPLGPDGAGGWYCLDIRAVVSPAAANAGVLPVAWSHAGYLGF